MRTTTCYYCKLPVEVKDENAHDGFYVHQLCWHQIVWANAKKVTDLSQMTPEQLYDLNMPLRIKIDGRKPLTAEEQELHDAICAEVLRRVEAQRATELAVRLANQEPNWKHCQCESCVFVRSVLLR